MTAPVVRIITLIRWTTSRFLVTMMSAYLRAHSMRGSPAIFVVVCRAMKNCGLRMRIKRQQCARSSASRKAKRSSFMHRLGASLRMAASPMQSNLRSIFMSGRRNWVMSMLSFSVLIIRRPRCSVLSITTLSVTHPIIRRSMT